MTELPESPDRGRDKTRESKKEREREKIRARKPSRVTYDLPPALRQRIKALADEQGLPASQLVALALLRFLSDWERGEVPLSRYKQPSRSPRYDWNLSYPPELTAALKPRRKS